MRHPVRNTFLTLVVLAIAYFAWLGPNLGTWPYSKEDSETTQPAEETSATGDGAVGAEIQAEIDRRVAAALEGTDTGGMTDEEIQTEIDRRVAAALEGTDTGGMTDEEIQAEIDRRVAAALEGTDTGGMTDEEIQAEIDRQVAAAIAALPAPEPVLLPLDGNPLRDAPDVGFFSQDTPQTYGTGEEAYQIVPTDLFLEMLDKPVGVGDLTQDIHNENAVCQIWTPPQVEIVGAADDVGPNSGGRTNDGQVYTWWPGDIRSTADRQDGALILEASYVKVYYTDGSEKEYSPPDGYHGQFVIIPLASEVDHFDMAAGAWFLVNHPDDVTPVFRLRQASLNCRSGVNVVIDLRPGAPAEAFAVTREDLPADFPMP